MGREERGRRIRAQQHPRLDRRNRRRGARRGRRQCVRMRHDREGLRPSVCARSDSAQAMRNGSQRSTRDVSEILARIGICQRAAERRAYRVAYHDPCSMQHGQRVTSSRARCSRRRLRGGRGAGAAFLLRLGRHLQSAAARHRRDAGPSARPRMSRAPIRTSSRPAISAAWCNCGRYLGMSGRSHSRAARLGDRRTASACACKAANCAAPSRERTPLPRIKRRADDAKGIW